VIEDALRALELQLGPPESDPVPEPLFDPRGDRIR
jgi:hypothetical protein